MTGPAPQPATGPADLLDAARAHLGAGRHAEAEAACGALLAAEPDHAVALHLLALAHGQSGRLAEAAQLLARATELAPGNGAARNDLGAMLIALGRPADAEVPLRAAVALAPANPEAHVNLGNALHAQGKAAPAEAAYRQALALEPRHVRGLVSLGNLLAGVRRPEEAAELLATAAGLAPEAGIAHHFLGNALTDLGRREDALASYRRALELEPANPEIREKLASLLKGRGDLEEALVHYRASGTPFSRAQALDCEFRLGRPADAFAWLDAHAAGEAANLHSASLAAYAAWHGERPDPHPFCPDPMRHVRVLDRYTSAADAAFIRDLIAEAMAVEAIWEPKGVTTTLGFQTGGNLFTHAAGNPGGAIAKLQRDLGEEVLRYRDALAAAMAPATAGIVSHWPARTRLHGWFVRLVTGGHQAFHNHPFGWMSGCLYLQVPRQSPPGEGDIEFGLEGDGFPRLSGRPSPTRRHSPQPGQLALFPSSLFHRTIPFRSDEERLCIAFDLLPA